MITSLFRKSTPINYSLVVILFLLFFSLIQIKDHSEDSTSNTIIHKLSLLGLFLASFFIVNFIAKKNGLTKNSSYPILFFLLLLGLFPTIFRTPNLIYANFFLLLAYRRLISLQNLNAIKQKLFDASFWICVAALFHFWCILFIFLVYISIIFHSSRDYRNWLIPFIAIFTTVTIFILAALIFDISWISFIIEKTKTNFQLDYFTNNIQNLALSIYVVLSLFFVFSMIFTLSNKPMILQASYKKMIFGFMIGVVVFLISINKSNAMLVFTFLPLSILCTNNIEYSQNKTYQEIVLALFIAAGFFSFFSQL
ncbi:DUF6427 family protein [Flavobacterium capsici]|uniref:DUF6427 family protein n=1 Tax=Flavobacterium capsici TaxID=3075618 RepID=A0AA96EW64_9FLAO|nr:MULTISPECIES: DUF6427 family protein [unclassified Flavobacterium]WNM19684.1 DUF6427 family protein [Flavobacterium sp. PMR2A8]WNM21073.1 DUF6427 family protein [Flavobacterium sp. PMTSA4]